LKFKWHKKPERIYLMDENSKMSLVDKWQLKKCEVINSTDRFKKGTKDETLTFWAKKEGWVIVTKDIRLALRSLMDVVPVIYISDDDNTISFLHVQLYGRDQYPEMYDYINKRFGYHEAKNNIS